jgi:hypothetical protein
MQATRFFVVILAGPGFAAFLARRSRSRL